MKYLFCLLISLLSIFASSAAEIPAIESLRLGDFETAITGLSGDLGELAGKTEGIEEDELRLHYARALYLSGKHEEAVKECAQLLRSFPKSVWRHKALFLKAQALAAERKFEEALVIYQGEAGRLFQSDRQDEIAGELVKFAELFATEPEPEDLEGSPADYGKALTLLQQALETNCSLKVRELIKKRLVEINGRIEKWDQVEQEALSYLAEFDPLWRGKLGSVRWLTSEKNPAAKASGSGRFEVRYRHAEALHRLGRRSEVTRYLQDLDQLLDGKAKFKALRADAHWLRLMAMTNQGSVSNANLWIAEARTFLKRYPNHIWAPGVVLKIASTYEVEKLPEKARLVHREFLDGKGYQGPLEKPLTTDQKSRLDFEGRKRQHQQRRENSSYQIGAIFLAEMKFAEAEAQWLKTSRNFPNGEKWADCQKGLVQVDFERALESVRESNRVGAEKKAPAREAARQLLEGFLRDHPLDARLPQLMFILGEMAYHEGTVVEEEEVWELTPKRKELLASAISSWGRLVSKYPASAQAKVAELKIGEIYEKYFKDLEKAVEIYSRLKDGQMRKQVLLQKVLKASSSRVFGTTEEPAIELDLRNVEKVTVRQYWVDFESYFRKSQNLAEIENLDVDLVEPDKTWEVKVAKFQRYHEIKQEVKIPFPAVKAGVCVIKVEGGDLENTTVVVRSDIELAIRAGRTESLVFVNDWKTGKPAPGVKLILADGAKEVDRGVTDKNGVWISKVKDLKEIDQLRVLAISGRGMAGHSVSLAGLHLPVAQRPVATMTASRQIHRPGETVTLKVLVKDFVNDGFVAPKDNEREFLLTVKTEQGLILDENEVLLNDFGAAATSFKLPEELKGGVVKLSLKGDVGGEEKDFTSSLRIHHERLGRARLKLEFEKEYLKPGLVAKGKVTAEYRWGAPISGRKIELKMPGGIIRELMTNEDGVAEFSYPTTGRGVGGLQFQVTLPGIQANPVWTSVKLVEKDYRVTGRLKQSVVIAGSPFELNLKTVSLAGDPIAQELKVVVAKKVYPGADPVLTKIPGLGERTPLDFEDQKVAEKVISTDATSGVTTVGFTLNEGGYYSYQVLDGENVVASGSLTVSDDEDPGKLHLFSMNEDLNEGMTASFKLHSRLTKTVPALVTIERDRILEHRIIEVKRGMNEIEVALKAVHSPGFRIHVMAFDERRLHNVESSIVVERKLDVAMTVMGPKEGIVTPGQEIKVKLKVTDASGAPVQSDAMVSLVRTGDKPSSLMNVRRLFQGAVLRQGFRTSSSCGFQHQGLQQGVNLFVQNEVIRQQVDFAPNTNSPTLLPQTQSAQAAASFDDREGIFVGGVSSGGLPQEPFLDQLQRDRFEMAPDESLWSFDRLSEIVRTDAKGECVIEMTPPDSADDWLVMGEAVSESGAIGSGKEWVRIQKDLTVALMSPFHILEGDVFSPKFIVSRARFNRAEEGRVVLSIQEDGKDPEVTEKKISFKKGQKSLELFFPKVTMSKAALDFDLTCQLEERRAVREGTLYPTPFAAPVLAGNRGILVKPGNNSFTVTLPEGAQLQDLIVRSQTSIGNFLDTDPGPPVGALDEIIFSQFGLNLVTELAQLPHDEKVENIPWLKELRIEEMESTIASLIVRQGEDGGWSGYEGRSRSDVGLSAILYEALVKAKKLDLFVDKSTLTRAEGYLQQMIAKSDGDQRAQIQQALSLGGKGDFSVCNRLFRSREELSSRGRAHLALAFIRLNRPEFARQLLEGLGEIDGGDVGTLGYALQAWVSLDPKQEVVVSLEERIFGEIGSFSNSSIASFGAAYMGLSDLYLEREPVKNDFEVTLSLNGKEIATKTSAALKAKPGFDVPPGALKTGENKFEISMKGEGFLRISASIGANLPKFPVDDHEGELKVLSREFFRPGLTYRGLSLSSLGRSPATKVALGDRVRVEVKVRHRNRENGEIVMIEKIPAGFEYLKGSLSGAHSGAEVMGGDLFITHVGTMPNDKVYSYELVAIHPGAWRIYPSLLISKEHPERPVYGLPGKLEILSAGERVAEEYRYQVNERFELANLHFRNGEFDEAGKHLIQVQKESPNYQSAEVARMILWIETGRDLPNARLVADSFEVLNELSPDLEIPFRKILKVGNAYRELNEFERGVDVFLATLEAEFGVESFVGAALQDQGRFLDARDYQVARWMEFPDYGEVTNSWFALAQQVYGKAAKADELQPRKGEKKAPNARELYLESVAMLKRFLVMAPSTPLADDAAFTIANTLFTLKSYEEMVKHTKSCQLAYADSDFAEAFKYLEGLGNFWLRNYEEAFKAAEIVAEGKGKDRNLAAYICAQILHAQGKAVDALKWYEKVKDEYPDAKDSIAWFEQKKISLDEVKLIRSGEKVEITLNHRNISKADLQIYRVDLMKLYLREKNLSQISKVNLAGISPKHELTIDLENKGSNDEETTVTLPMKNDGAYLVICRGDYLYASGLVLVTPLKMEVQEIARGSTIRVNVSDQKSGELLDGVHVKAIGANNGEFFSGDTDLRGVWSTSGLEGAVTVIARDPKGRYAFYRGVRAIPKPVVPSQKKLLERGFNANNYLKQDMIIQENSGNFEKLRRSKSKGVKVNKAIKK